MQIALYGRTIQPKDTDFITHLLQTLLQGNNELIIEENFLAQLKNTIALDFSYTTFTKSNKLPIQTEMLFSIGGDGTLLDTVTFVQDSKIPILGINAGRLGFLTGVNKADTNNAIKDVLKGNFTLDKRSLIALECNSCAFVNAPFALNEFAILKKDTSAMITIHTYLNGELLTSYFADGLIISTATGSTAYNLSCGGPILIPTSENFVITPIAPHNLNIRPIVVPDTSIISFEIEGRSEAFHCSMDSRIETLDYTAQLAVKKAPFTINLVRLNDTNFLQTLSKKMNWGKDSRY